MTTKPQRPVQEPKAREVPAEPTAPDPTEQARQVLEQARQARAVACEQEIAQALKRHGCTLDVAVLVTAAGNQPQIRIVPRE